MLLLPCQSLTTVFLYADQEANVLWAVVRASNEVHFFLGLSREMHIKKENSIDWKTNSC